MLIATKLTLCLFTVETCVVSMLILCVNAQFNLNAPNRHSSSANSLPLEPLQFNPLESSPPNEPTPETNDAMSASPYSNNHFVQSEPIQVYSNDPKLSGTDSRDGQPAAIVDAGNIDQTSATLNAPTYSPYNRYPQPSSKTYVGAYYPNYYNSMYPSGFGAYPNAYGLGSYNPNPLQPLVGHFYAKFQPVAQFFQKITGKLMAPFASKFMPGYGYGTHLGSPYTNAFDYNSYGKMFPYKSPAALFRNEPRARNLDEPGLYVNGPTYNMQPNTFGSSILNGNPTEIAPRENWAIGAKSVQAEPGRLAKLIQNGGNPAQFSYREQFHSNSVVNGKQTSTSGVISLKSPENGTPTGVVNAVQNQSQLRLDGWVGGLQPGIYGLYIKDTQYWLIDEIKANQRGISRIHITHNALNLNQTNSIVNKTFAISKSHLSSGLVRTNASKPIESLQEVVAVGHFQIISS